MSKLSRRKEWRLIPDFPDYEVSECGDVRRIKDGVTRKAGHTLSGNVDVKGYRRDKLSRNGKKTLKQAHALVLEVFVGPRPTRKHQGAHWDGNRLNNHISNLRWATSKENIADRFRHGTDMRGERNGRAKLSSNDVAQIRSAYKAGAGRHGLGTSLARQYGVSSTVIYHIASERLWPHVG